MIHPLNEAKIRADLLLGDVRRSDPEALKRLAILSEFRSSRPTPEEMATSVQRRHCLAVVAREFGFEGWPHCRRVFAGEEPIEDFGTMLYPKRCGGFLNSWYRDHASAAACRVEVEGYLLPHRRDFMVVGREFVTTLGLDPDDSDWREMGFDWARPLDPEARVRLYGRLLRAAR